METNSSYQPLVSIITIVYNGEEHLRQTLESVFNQSYKNIEYILIDGGSTDNTLSILENYRQRFAFLVSEKDKGVSDAFNKGLKLARGEIIGLINADDWYEADAVEKAVAAIAHNDVVYGDLRLWKNEKPDVVFEGDHRQLPNEMTINHPTVFVRSDCYQKHGGFDLQYRLAMDYDLLLRFYLNKFRFCHIPAVLANMRWDGLSDKNWLKGCKEVLAIKNKYQPHLRRSNKLYFYKHVLANSAAKLLQKLRLHQVTKWYRSKFSKIKKTYD